MPVTLVDSDWVSGNLVFKKIGSGATTGIHFGVDGTGLDVKFFGDTASSFMLWDQSADELVFDAASLHLGDNDELRLGDLAAGDVVHKWTGSAYTTTLAATAAWNIGSASANANITLRGTLTVGADASGNDTKIFSTTASAYWLFDVSGDELICEGTDIHLNDNDELRLGDAAAGDIVHVWTSSVYNTTAAATSSWNIGTTSANLNTTIKGTLTVGADTEEYDFRVYGSTTGKYMLFDASEDKLIVSGTSDLGTSAEMDAITIGGTAGVSWVSGASPTSMEFINGILVYAA